MGSKNIETIIRVSFFMTESSTTKQIHISADALKGGKRGVSRKKKVEKHQQVPEEPKQKKTQQLQVMKIGGGVLGQNLQENCGVPGYQNPLQVSSASPLSLAFKPLVDAKTLEAPIPVAGASLPFGGPGQTSMQTGGKLIKLHKKGYSPKVKLNSKKPEAKKAVHHHTKKNRRIVLGLVGLKNRQTKANKIKESVKEMPLEDLKKHLIARGLIKPTSKAPESILRQIAADSQIVGGNAL
jgi:hypothetical protein